MFSDHLQKMNPLPKVNLLAAAAVLVMVCQLAALALVVDRQVKQASARELQRITQEVAMADCVERSTGLTRHSCIRQTQTVLLAGDEVSASGGRGRFFSAKNVAAADGITGGELANLMPAGLAPTR